MAKIIIKVEKEDVHTSKMGINYMIDIDDLVSLVFSSEAIEELINDYHSYENGPSNITWTGPNNMSNNTDAGTHQGRDFPYKDE
jgi:hypothetical protein